MRSYLIRLLIFFSCAIFSLTSQFALAGGKVHLTVINETGDDLPTVGTCINPRSNDTCRYPFKTIAIKPGAKGEINTSEVDLSDAFTTIFALTNGTNADKPNKYLCYATIKGRMNANLPDQFGAINLTMQPDLDNKSDYICSSATDRQELKGGQSVERVTVTVRRKLTSLSPAPVRMMSLISDDSVLSENLRDGEHYDVTCVNGTTTTFKLNRGWTNGIYSYPYSPNTMRQDVAEAYCKLVLTVIPPEFYYMKTSSLNKKEYSVECFDGKTTTFHSNDHFDSWTNGSLTISLPKDDWDIVKTHWKYLRFYVGERYCGNLSGPFVPAQTTSYLVASTLNTADSSYAVTCANGTQSTFAYYADHEFYGDVDHAYRIKKQFKDDQNFLNATIAENYCQQSLPLNPKGNVDAVIAGTGTDAYGVARSYAVICKKPSALTRKNFWRTDQSQASWTNFIKTYPLMSDAALFNSSSSSDRDRYNIIVKNVAEPYCAGK